MSEKWVDACASAGAFVGARQHLLKDPAAEKKFGFSLAAAWEAAQQQLLLSGTRVFLTPGHVIPPQGKLPLAKCKQSQNDRTTRLKSSLRSVTSSCTPYLWRAAS